jgi:hypothetical protein
MAHSSDRDDSGRRAGSVDRREMRRGLAVLISVFEFKAGNFRLG